MTSNRAVVRVARRAAMVAALALMGGATLALPVVPAAADEFVERPSAEVVVPIVDPTSATPAVATPVTRAAPAAAPATAGGTGTRIVYSNSKQRVWAYSADGTLVHTYPVSGRRGVPRPGEYRVFSRSALASSGTGVTMKHMVRFARGRSLAIGFHEIPRRRNGSMIQSLGELGQFRSKGCVRQSPSDALFLWNFAPIGTRVTVTA